MSFSNGLSSVLVWTSLQETDVIGLISCLFLHVRVLEEVFDYFILESLLLELVNNFSDSVLSSIFLVQCLVLQFRLQK